MKWGFVKAFGLRFGICLLLFGGAYGLVRAEHKPPPPSPKDKLAELRSALEQSYLEGRSMTAFSENDAVTGDTLQRLVSQLQSDTATLSTDHQDAASLLSPAQNAQIDKFISLQQQADGAYKSVDGVLGKAISYDPGVDLESLDSGKDATTLSGRAGAAARGLQKVVDNQQTAADSGALSVQSDNGPDPLVSARTKQLASSSIACFQRLADQAGAHQSDAANTTRQECTQNYPALRAQALQDLLSASFSQQYKQALQAQAQPLASQLDTAIRGAAAH